VTNLTYDQYGNRTSVTNARGYSTNYTYDSNSLCLTQKTVAVGQPNQRTFTYGACDFNTSLPSSETDADHNIAQSFGYDKFGRLTHTTETGGSLSRSKVIAYRDGLNNIFEQSDLNSLNDGQAYKTTWYDPLGRVRETVDAAHNIVQTLRYAPPSPLTTACETTHAYQAVSNPSAYGQGETTPGWTRTAFDQNGRPIEVQHIAGGGAAVSLGIQHE